MFSWYNVEKIMVYMRICPNGQTVSAVDSSASWVNVSRCEFKSSYIIDISEITLKQATADEWFQVPHFGMITASTAHEVLRKVDKHFNIRSVHVAKICVLEFVGTQNQYQVQHYPEEKQMKKEHVRDTDGKQDLCINTFPVHNLDYIQYFRNQFLEQVLMGS